MEDPHLSNHLTLEFRNLYIYDLCMWDLGICNYIHGAERKMQTFCRPKEMRVDMVVGKRLKLGKYQICVCKSTKCMFPCCVCSRMSYGMRCCFGRIIECLTSSENSELDKRPRRGAGPSRKPWAKWSVVMKSSSQMSFFFSNRCRSDVNMF